MASAKKISYYLLKTNNSFLYRLTGILLLLTFLQTNVFAQFYQVQVTTITDKSGAPPSATFAIVEDQHGFIWFGTIDGLYRFDGFNYKIYRNEPHVPNTLSNNTIRDMAIDSKGKIWIATQGGGVDEFDPVTETFRNYKYTGHGENEISGNTLWSVLVDKKDNIWIGITGKGIDRIDTYTRKVTHYSVLEDSSSTRQGEAIRSIMEDKEGLIWVGIKNRGIASVNPLTGKVKDYFHEYGNETNLSNDQPFDLYLGDDNNIWIATFGGGINIFNPNNESFSHIRYSTEHHSIVSDLTYSICERTPGEYWIATEYGISVYNNKTGFIKNFQQNSSGSESISENRARKIFIDSKGIVWVGTESGVERFVSQSNFKIYSNFLKSDTEINKGIVKALATDDENLWVGLIDNGLVKYSFKDNSSTRYFYDPNIKNSLSGSNINSILVDYKGTMWLSDWNTGLMIYNSEKDNYQHISNAYFEQNRLIDNRIQKLLEGKPGIIWIATEGGLNKYNSVKDEFISYKHDPENSNSLSSDAIQAQAIVFDGDSNLWIGTWSFGLNKMVFTDSSRTAANFVRYRHNPDNEHSLPNDNVISLLYDSTCLWIGTFGGGLCKLDLQTDRFINYTIEDGLPNNIIFGILKDKNGNLWLSTDYGISMFNPKNEIFQNYTKQDGLQDNHFFWGAVHADKNGIFYMGGVKGVNSFVPENVKPDSSPAKPVIVDIKLFNKSISSYKEITNIDKVEFHSHENFISFEFAALDYSEPNRNKYKYLLDGFDKDWVTSTGINSASYTNLPPGNYTFLLQVSNSNGIWNKDILELKVIIIPPWWKTSLARILFTIFIISSVFGIYRIRIRVLQRQKRTLELEVKNRTIEIAEKNRRLSKQKEEISRKNNKLNQQKNELSDRNKYLKQTLDKLETAQNALIESEKMASLGILTAGVAHEINNPLNFISVSIENIKMHLNEFEELLEKSNKEKLIELYELISHSETGVERISKIIGDLNQFLINNDEGYTSIKPEEVINSATTILAHKIPAYITLNIDTQTSERIKARKHRLAQVFINIIDNALQAIDEKETKKDEAIEIAITEQDHNNIKCILCKISNTGPAIPDKELKNIFDPFFTTKQPNKGTGLGLYITYSIINEHKGFIHAKNENGKVVFYIFVPIVETE